ncbi:hypothetical protein Patl1_09451 [Pistacia atlantica]|uniref:Uncharacterized protein n=1 Tax=Pistacia atlantica TaxID=434234 RepID=A0ACC1AKV7_9ROSI|nr:hypothetical protein Patl1_09451 [Pistacia atlantica]
MLSPSTRSTTSLHFSAIWNSHTHSAESDKYGREVESNLCQICLGILHFTHCDDKEMLVKKENAKDLAVTTVDSTEVHQIDGSSLGVSRAS